MLKLVENVFNMVPRKKLNCVKWMDVLIEFEMVVFVEGMGLLMLDGVLLVVLLVEIKNVAAAIIMMILAATSTATVHQQKNENEEIAQQQIVLINRTLEEYVVNMVQK